MHKGNGLVRDVFRTRNMRSLGGHSGIAHVRYPTAGSAGNSEEAQPFYVNAPFGIMLAHNGNLTNSEQLKDEMFRRDRRHINTDSRLRGAAERAGERAAGVGARRLARSRHDLRGGRPSCTSACAAPTPAWPRSPATACWRSAIRSASVRCATAWPKTDQGVEYLVASESVALEGLGFRMVRDVAPGEAVFIDLDGNFHSRQCAPTPSLNPVHVRVRLLRAARLDHRRRLGVRGAAAHGRVPGREDGRGAVRAATSTW